MWQVIIRCVFILSALALAAIDRMSYHEVSPHEAHDGVVVAVADAAPTASADERELVGSAPVGLG